MTPIYCNFISRLLLAACAVSAVASAALADEPALPEPGHAESKPIKVKPSDVKPLLPEQVTLRNQLRQAVANVRKQNFNTSQNNVDDILNYCLAFGCSSEITDVQNNRRLNGITCVCWNLACSGYEPLTVIDGHLTPRIGFGYQESASQMAATLAFGEVPLTYPARSGDSVRSVADIIAGEKLSCLTGTNMGLKLVALSSYVGNRSWKNSLGETWNIERVVASELDRTPSGTPHDVVYRWMGLSAALRRYERNDKPLTGDMQRAKQFETESIQYALRVQNPDGSWGPAIHRDYSTTLSHTGFMLEWLVMAMPQAQLDDSQIERSVAFVVGLLNSAHYQVEIQNLSSQEISAVMHTVHALNVYDERCYAPHDVAAAPAASAAAPAAGTVR